MRHIIIILLLIMGFISGCTDIKGEPVTYKSGNTVLKGYISYDSNIREKRPGIIVVHEWWGHNEYVRRRARMLAELGYTAFALDMYGDGKQAMHPDEAGGFAREIMKNMDIGAARFIAAMDYLKKHETVDPDRIAAIGYCFGGSVVLNMARAGVDLEGVVSFHGGLATNRPAKQGEVNARILVCHGGDDTMVLPEQLSGFREEMKNADADFQIITYEGAKHSFTNPDADAYAEKFDINVGYNAEADRKSWEDMKDFLNEVFQ